MGAEKDVYRRVISITNHYLGPAAERFIDRQVRNHLKKEPEKLTRRDLVRLVDWISTAFSLLTEDRKLVEEYITQLQDLSQNSSKSN